MFFIYCFATVLISLCIAKNNTLKFAKVIDVVSPLPEGCTDAHGPHTRECLSSLWVLVGCLESGHNNPDRMREATFLAHSTLHLNEVALQFVQLYNDALSLRDSAQKACFGHEVPPACLASLHGGHSRQCLSTLWLRGGCVEDTTFFPSILEDTRLSELKSLTVNSVIEYIQNIANGNTEADQIACYGVKFPPGCKQFRGKQSLNCLVNIWTAEGCTNEGLGYPVESNIPRRRTITDLLDEVSLLVNQAEEINDEGAQMQCYGIAFPAGCKRYRGPHTPTCKKQIFLNAGCLEQGNRFDYLEFDTRLDGLNLVQLKAYMNGLSRDPATRHRLECYGIEFAVGCNTLLGTHSLSCIRGMFLQAGCIEDGGLYQNTSLLTEFTDVPLNEMYNYFVDLYSESSPYAELNCFGFDFPATCTAFEGPHSLKCLQDMWLFGGCILDGTNYPTADKIDLLAYLQPLNLRDVLKFVKNYTAFEFDRESQQACFGIAFPLECNSFFGPHSVACLQLVWLQAGCLEDGNPFFDFGYNETMKYEKYNIYEILKIFEELSFGFSPKSQKDCYGIVFPRYCITYKGPHSLQCLSQIWLDSGCDSNGFLSPENLDDMTKADLEHLPLRLLVNRFEEIYKAGLTLEGSAELDCFGITFPDSCTTYMGPHNIRCVLELWAGAGCLEDGSYFPGSWNPSLREKLNNRTVMEVRRYMLQLARVQNQGDDVKCYGFEFPEHCYSFTGQHSVECLNEMWLSAGCLKQGTHYPSTLQRSNPDMIKNMQDWTLRELRTTYHQASVLPAKQIECYDYEFPDDCTSYTGPHSFLCKLGIWENAGCVAAGYQKHASNKELHEEVDFYNLPELEEYTRRIARLDTPLSQEFCHGFEFPFGCLSFKGPHEAECKRTLWKQTKCLEDGEYNPTRFNLAQDIKLDNFTLSDLIAFYERLNDAMDSESQIGCYGFEFPIECPSFNGPHSSACMKWFWIKSGCIPEGEGYPHDSSVGYAKNQLQIQQEYDDVIEAAKLGNEEAQRMCFGLIFPPGCTLYSGNTNIQCFNSMWESVGCSSNGRRWPANRDSTDIDYMYNQTLIDIHSDMKQLYQATYEEDSEAQLDCFGVDFPDGCKSASGPHSFDCINTIYHSAGCLDEGKYAPNKLKNEELRKYTYMTIEELENLFGSWTYKPSPREQLACYGITFPDGCESYEGPNPIVCYVVMWQDAECLKSGAGFPGNLPPEELEELDAFNIYDILERFAKVQLDSSKGSKVAQLRCYGTSFPGGCLSFFGPHSLDCIVNVWKLSGCLDRGMMYPRTTLAEEKYGRLNLVDLEDIFRSLTEFPDADEQILCYGIEFPYGCENYYGPFSSECKHNIWTSAGCLTAEFPLSVFAVDPDTYNVEDLLAYADEVVSKADDKDATAQEDCYGFKYPKGCKAFDGPHTKQCLSYYYYAAGCIDNGHSQPNRLQSHQEKKFDQMNLIEVENAMFEFSDGAGQQHQLACFGLVFPDGCESYWGPHSIVCHALIWKDVGCLESGTGYPEALKPGQLEVIDTLSITELIENREELYHAATHSDDMDKQLLCYGIVIPRGCKTYHGPHTTECLQSIWEASNCFSDGYKSPKFLTLTDKAVLNDLTIPELRERMYAVYEDALSLLPEAQLNCYGYVLPENCIRHFGPFTRGCLKQVYYEAGCLKEGWANPENISSALLYEQINEMEISDVIAYFQNMIEEPDIEAQLNCYGFLFASGCTAFEGPHSYECLVSLWYSSGCFSEGHLFNPNLQADDEELIAQFTLLGVKDYFHKIGLRAEQGDTKAQLDCYGIIFPDGCRSFHEQHTEKCLRSIWKSSKCIDDGQGSPDLIPVRQKLIQAQIDIQTLKEKAEDVYDQALSGDEDAQRKCFGFAFPEGCVSFVGPNPPECFGSIWISVGCTTDGALYPPLLPASKLIRLNAYNLKEAFDYVSSIIDLAVKGDAAAQHDCYGFYFPSGCDSFSGPHTKQCKISVWEEAGCQPEGYQHPENISTLTSKKMDDLDLVYGPTCF